LETEVTALAFSLDFEESGFFAFAAASEPAEPDLALALAAGVAGFFAGEGDLAGAFEALFLAAVFFADGTVFRDLEGEGVGS
jgi:hypothetical protein